MLQVFSRCRDPEYTRTDLKTFCDFYSVCFSAQAHAFVFLFPHVPIFRRDDCSQKAMSSDRGNAPQCVADTARERAASHALLNVQALSDYLFDGRRRHESLRQARKVMESESVFRNDDYYHSSREERCVHRQQGLVKL